MSYRDTVKARAACEAGKMHGQPIKAPAKVLILAGLFGGLFAVRKGCG